MKTTLPQSIIAVALLSVVAKGGSVSAGPLGELQFTAHGNFSAGLASSNVSELATHGHDPKKNLSVQGVDFGLSLRGNKYLEGFINANVLLDPENKLTSELEEGFLKLKNLPGGFELRGGRYLNRLGMNNNVHLHGWNFANADLSAGAFMGEDGLRSHGVEASWVTPYEFGNFIISSSYGETVSDEHAEDPHAPHDEAKETTEKSYFKEKLSTTRAQLDFNADDFNQHKVGLNFAQGENGYKRGSQLFSADYMYQWSESGLSRTGRRWFAGVEHIQRNVEWVDEADPTIIGSVAQQNTMGVVGYGFNKDLDVAMRYGRVEGLKEGGFEANERRRLSLAVTQRYQFSDFWRGQARVQYNNDDLAEKKRRDSVFLQLGFSYGGKGVVEVR